METEPKAGSLPPSCLLLSSYLTKPLKEDKGRSKPCLLLHKSLDTYTWGEALTLVSRTGPGGTLSDWKSG